ncbi:MAG: IMP cyclohydrolase, partial [Fervidobacterium sp.]
IGAIIVYINSNLIVGLTENIPSKIVDLEKSGGRLCDLTGEVVVIKNLTLDIARKLRESNFKIIAYNVTENETELKEILKGKELISFTYEEMEAKKKISVSKSVENILFKSYVEIQKDSKNNRRVLEFIMNVLPKYAVAIENKDGYITINIDLHDPITLIEKSLERTLARPFSVATNFEPDGLFKKICNESGVEKIETFKIW